MTVSKEYNKHIYKGNGLTTDWPYDFDLPLTSSGDPDTSLIHVFRTNLRGEVTEVTAFSVDAETGTLTYPTSGSPLETGEKLTILRLLDVRQQFFDPSNQANLYPETLEDNTDRLVMMIQQTDEEVGRAVTMGEGYEGEEVTAEGLLEARDIAISAAETAEGYAAQLLAIADELGVNLVTDEADLRAKITAIGASDATLVIATSISLAEDLTIPSNIALAFKNTGSLEPAVTKTLTINGPVDAGLWQIFGGEGTVTGTPQIPYVYPEWFGAVGDGVTDNSAAFTAALAAIDTAKSTLYLPAGTYVLGADITIPENVCLKFDKGAVLSVSNTYTLTINGPIEAGLWQIFGGEGTVTGTPQIPYVYPEWFGAVGDGITDDVAAVQAAIAIPAVIKLSKPYLISDTLSIDGTGCTGMVWEGDARTNRFLYTGTGTAIEVSGLWYATGYEFRVQKSSIDWVSEDAGADRTSIGIHFLNGLTEDWVIRCEFNFKYVKSFAYGIKFDGVFTWNKADIGNITDCWTGMYFDTYLNTGDYQVWNNQNTFIGGEIKFQSSTLLEGVPVTGSTMLHLNGNGNTFLGFCLEGRNMEWCVTGDAAANQFLNTRLEVVGDGKINLLNTLFVSYPNVWSGYFLKRDQFTEAARLTNSILGPAYYDLNGSSANGIAIINNVGSAKKILTVGVHNQPDVAGALTTGRTLEMLPNKISTFRGNTSYPQPTVKIDGSATGKIYFSTGGGSSEPNDGFPGVRGSSANNTDLVLSGSRVIPVADDTMNIGISSARYNDIFATNGTIQTSDEREKVDIRDLSEAEKTVALKVKGMLRAFRWKKSVAEKGDEARIHFGVMAQQVAQVFRDEGLDPERYALFCYDEWDETPEITDEEGNIIQQYIPAGNRYGIRYSELLAFVIGAM